jgi:hypothetical protein
LAPHLQKILAAPPTIAIRVNHILGLVDLHDSLTFPQTFWDWFVRRLSGKRSSCVKKIRRYRDGTLSEEMFRIRLKVVTFTLSVDTEMLEALTAFILRTMKYLDTKPKTMYTHPPLTVVVEVPDSFTGLTVIATTTKAKRFGYKIMFPHSPPPPLIRSGRGDLPWLLHRFAWHASWAGDWRSVISFSVKLKFLDAADGEIGWPTGYQLQESALHMAIINGVRDAGRRGKGLLYYGGLVQERVRDEM